MTPAAAIVIVAYKAAADIIGEAVTFDRISWENYPEIGEDDWNTVLSEVDALRMFGVEPDPDEYASACELLANQAG